MDKKQTMTSKKEQYEAGGPFDKWLKTVKTCRSRTECCQPVAGYGNIIVRDFATRSFTSSVINKNFMNPSGDELKCEQYMIVKERVKALAEDNEKKLAEAQKAAAAGV